MFLRNLPSPKSKKTTAKRIGRGYGCGRGGHTVGRGQKGQKSRTSIRPGFVGGETSQAVRTPKRPGFKTGNPRPAVADLAVFSGFRAGSTITPEKLVEKGSLKAVPAGGVKILANGDLSKKLKFEGFLVSATAKKRIEAAGGEVL